MVGLFGFGRTASAASESGHNDEHSDGHDVMASHLQAGERLVVSTNDFAYAGEGSIESMTPRMETLEEYFIRHIKGGEKQ